MMRPELNIFGSPITMVSQKTYDKMISHLPPTVQAESVFGGSLNADGSLILVIARAEPFSTAEIESIRTYFASIDGVMEYDSSDLQEGEHPLIVVSKINLEKVESQQ